MPLHLLKNYHDFKSTIVIYSQSGVIQIEIFVVFFFFNFYVVYAHLHPLIASFSHNGLFFCFVLLKLQQKMVGCVKFNLS